MSGKKKTAVKADKKEDKITSNEVSMKDATAKVEKVATYRGENIVSVYTLVNHGKDFKKIAEAHAERDGLDVKPVIDTPKPEEAKDTVVVVGPDGTQVMRTYSKEVHGKDYEKLAADFIEKHGKKGFTIKAPKVVEEVKDEEVED